MLDIAIASVDNWRGEYVHMQALKNNRFQKKLMMQDIIMNIRCSSYRRWLRH